MLNQLLDLLRHGGTHTVRDIARDLKTTSDMVEAMLETLGRMGYLRQLGESCGAHCGACPIGGHCTSEGSGRVWTLTDKGAAGSP